MLQKGFSQLPAEAVTQVVALCRCCVLAKDWKRIHPTNCKLALQEAIQLSSGRVWTHPLPAQQLEGTAPLETTVFFTTKHDSLNTAKVMIKNKFFKKWMILWREQNEHLCIKDVVPLPNSHFKCKKVTKQCAGGGRKMWNQTKKTLRKDHHHHHLFCF